MAAALDLVYVILLPLGSRSLRLEPATLLKRRLRQRCFPLQDTYGRLLLRLLQLSYSYEQLLQTFCNQFQYCFSQASGSVVTSQGGVSLITRNPIKFAVNSIYQSYENKHQIGLIALIIKLKLNKQLELFQFLRFLSQAN